MRLTIDCADQPFPSAAAGFQRTTRRVTVAELRALHLAPLALLPAVDAGQVYEVLTITGAFTAGAPYDVAGTLGAGFASQANDFQDWAGAASAAAPKLVGTTGNALGWQEGADVSLFAGVPIVLRASGPLTNGTRDLVLTLFWAAAPVN